MTVDDIKILPYQLIFKKEYLNSKLSIEKRNGWIIKISSNGVAGYGDSCPLNQFSEESYEQAGYGLEGFRLAMDGVKDIDFEEILQLSAAHGESQPSVQFAIETALYDLESKLNNIPLNKLLNSQSSPIVKINYYDNSNIKPFNGMIIKLKVIDNNFFNQVDRINKIIEKYNGLVKLRLDFNGSMDLPRAIRFCKMIEGKPIDYLEQPLPKDSFDDMYELGLHTDIPLAIDEMITGIETLEKALEYQCADVFILKPMLIGGISTCKEMIEMIKSESKRFNISSLLESNVGRLSYLNLCSAFNLSEESGIATDLFFNNDLCDFPQAIEGTIKLDSNPGIGINEICL